MENVNSIRWTRRKLLSYGAFLSMAVGARSIGKSYQGKDWAISKWITRRKTTKWVMRYQTELDKALHEADFMGGLMEKYALMGWQIYYDDNGCYIRYVPDGADEREIPWDKFMAFSTMSERAIKAAEDRSCELIVYDEFIPLPGTPLIKEEVTRFLEYVLTIYREREGGRILMLSNNVTPISPYFSYFHAHLPPKGEFYHDKARGIVIENCRNDAFAEYMRKTSFGRLVAGTDYAAYAIENESMLDLHTFVADRPGNARPLVRIDTYNGRLYLYVAPPGTLHISTDGPPTLPIWAVDDPSHKEGTQRIDFAGSLARSLIKRHYAASTLMFSSDKAKAIFMSSCSNLIK